MRITEKIRLRRDKTSRQHKINNCVYLSIVYYNRNEVLTEMLAPSIPDCIILGMNFWEKFGVKVVYCTIEAKQDEEVGENHGMKQLTSEQKKRLEQAIQKFPKAKLYEHRINVGKAQPRKQRH